MIMKKISRIFTLIAIASFLLIVYILTDAHRSRAALIPTQTITDKELLAELSPTNGLIYHFEDPAITTQYKDLIPEELKQGSEFKLEAFLEWFTKNYYAPVFKVENYARLSPEYPDLLIEQYKKKAEKGSCYNDAILFSFLAQVNGFEVRQVYFINKDGYGNDGHTMVEVWLNRLQQWVFVDIRNSALFYKNDEPYSALMLRDEILSLDSVSFYKTVSIVQFDGYNIAKQDLYSFFRRNCTDFAVSAFSNPQTKVANSYFYGLFHSISKKENKFLEKTSRFLRSLFDKSRVNYLLVDEYSGNKQYTVWYYAFNTSAFFLLIYFIWGLSKIFFFKRSKLKRSQTPS